MTQPVVALLGRRDEPTDAVEQYCLHLGAALRAHDFAMEIVRVQWNERGWPVALRNLRQKAGGWSGRWVLLQYTALAWSPRGFPLQVPRVIKILRDVGARIAVVYHDVQPYSGGRAVDQLRRFLQRRAMRQALGSSDQAILTVPAEKLSWISPDLKNVAFIPVGANFPDVASSGSESTLRQDETPTVAVFGVTGGEAGRLEVSQIVAAVRFAAEKLGKLRLLVFGRHADSAQTSLQKGLRDFPVALHVSGVLPQNDVARLLRSSDVLLFVRGPISSRRGSAIAGIACGLPVIAFAGSETAAPITDAGVVLVPGENKTALGDALVRVLSDRDYHARLAERSRAAHKNHFSWEAIAARYASVLNAPLEANKP
ncbi:MAG TPA: glycosyltransferase family 4 protein [Candidatus Acidoferrum sp.]